MTHAGALLADRFELLRQLGEDATASVWEGFDVALERRVRIRLLRPELSGDPVAVERFRQESRMAARAESTQQRRVLDAGFDQRGTLPFVVFEWQARSAGEDAPAREADAQAKTTRLPAQARPTVAPRSSGHRVLPRLAVLLLLVPVVAAAWFVRQVLDRSGGAGSQFVAPPAVTLVTRSPQPVVLQTAATPGSIAAQPTAATNAAQPTAASAPARPSPAASQVVAGRRRTIVNTDGIGVALRASPGGDKLPAKGYDEGAMVTLLEQSGEWSHIRGDDGREGWVLSVTLA